MALAFQGLADKAEKIGNLNITPDLLASIIENGIALPHPRKPVHTVILIVSESPKQHLNTLTKINFLCMDNDFYSLLASRAPKEKIIAAVEEAEKEWVR